MFPQQSFTLWTAVKIASLYRNVLLFSPTGRFSFSKKVDAVTLMLTIMGIINSVREKSLQDLFIYLIPATDPVFVFIAGLEFSECMASPPLKINSCSNLSEH